VNALIQVQLQHNVICCCGPGPAGALRGYGAVPLSQKFWRSPRSKTNQYINLNRRARSDCIVNIVDWVGPCCVWRVIMLRVVGRPTRPVSIYSCQRDYQQALARVQSQILRPLLHSTAVGTEAIWSFRLSHHPPPGKQGKHCYYHVHVQTEVIKFNKL